MLRESTSPMIRIDTKWKENFCYLQTLWDTRHACLEARHRSPTPGQGACIERVGDPWANEFIGPRVLSKGVPHSQFYAVSLKQAHMRSKRSHGNWKVTMVQICIVHSGCVGWWGQSSRLHLIVP